MIAKHLLRARPYYVRGMIPDVTLASAWLPILVFLQCKDLPALHGALLVAQLVKNPPVSAGDTRDVGSIPGSGRSPGVENGNPFQYSCLENSMDRGAWLATVHRVTNSQT